MISFFRFDWIADDCSAIRPASVHSICGGAKNTLRPVARIFTSISPSFRAVSLKKTERKKNSATLNGTRHALIRRTFDAPF